MPKRALSQCGICRHEKRHQLEIGLVHHVPLRVLAQRFGVSKDALHRHKRDHLSPQIAAAILAAQKPSAVDLEQLQASESERILSHGRVTSDIATVRTALLSTRDA